MKSCIVFAASSIVSIAAALAGPHRDRRESDFFFPPDNFLPNVPEACTNSTYCERKCTKYPQDHMDEIVMRDKLDRFSIEEFVIGNRASFDESEESTLCSSITRSEVLYEAQNEDGEWRYVVQSSARKFQQILIISVCGTPKGACNKVAVFQSSVSSRCEQQYADRFLFSLGPDGELVRGSFRIPSCCVCTFSYKE